MTTETTEWLTVAEAARRLGLSDRHARRLTDRLADSDRLKEGTSPLKVRLSALAQLWEREGPESERQTPSSSESDSEAISRARLEERLDAAETLVVELREDKRHLQETLQREQENHLRLLEQLADERRDMRLMHARTVQALPTMPEPFPSALSVSPALEPDSESDAQPYVPPPLPPQAAPTPEPPPPTFWQKLAHWLSD